MASLKHIFKINQKVRCNMDGDFYKGTVTEVHENYIIVDIPAISNHCYFERNINLDCVYPEYNF